jgi:hypothetical protein
VPARESYKPISVSKFSCIPLKSGTAPAAYLIASAKFCQLSAFSKTSIPKVSSLSAT